MRELSGQIDAHAQMDQTLKPLQHAMSPSLTRWNRQNVRAGERHQ